MTKTRIALSCVSLLVGACTTTASPQAPQESAAAAAASTSVREDGWLLRCHNAEDREYTVPITRVVPNGSIQLAYFELADGRRVTGRMGSGMTCMYVAPISDTPNPPRTDVALAPPPTAARAASVPPPEPLAKAQAKPSIAEALAKAPRPAPAPEPVVEAKAPAAMPPSQQSFGMVGIPAEASARPPSPGPEPVRAVPPPVVASAAKSTGTPPSAPASFVQFGALGSKEEAVRLWSSIVSVMPSLQATAPTVESADVNGKTFHRLRIYTGEKADSARICRQAKTVGLDCWQG